MKTSGVLTLSIVVTAIVSLICIWFYPSIHDFMAGNAMWNGINDFNEQYNADNIDTLVNLPDTPDSSVLVVIPYLEYSQDDMAKIKNFVENGGLLLLMDDFGYGNSILEYLGLKVRFSNDPLLDPLFCYKNQWLPKITDFAGQISDQNINLVLLNHATTLTNNDGTALAFSSPSSFTDKNGNEKKDDNERSGPFPVAAEKTYGKGMVVTVADPSVLISSMINRDDNYAFITYLMNLNGAPHAVMLDRSHLSKTPLDNSKIRLSGVRELMSNPYALTGVVALLFVVISRYTIRKGEAIG